jgi:hypothetical protein
MRTDGGTVGRTDMTEVIVVFDILRTRLNMVMALILLYKILNYFVNFVLNIGVVGLTSRWWVARLTG